MFVLPVVLFPHLPCRLEVPQLMFQSTRRPPHQNNSGHQIKSCIPNKSCTPTTQRIRSYANHPDGPCQTTPTSCPCPCCSAVLQSASYSYCPASLTSTSKLVGWTVQASQTCPAGVLQCCQAGALLQSNTASWNSGLPYSQGMTQAQQQQGLRNRFQFSVGSGTAPQITVCICMFDPLGPFATCLIIMFRTLVASWLSVGTPGIHAPPGCQPQPILQGRCCLFSKTRNRSTYVVVLRVPQAGNTIVGPSNSHPQPATPWQAAACIVLKNW